MSAIEDILLEVERATRKFPTWPTDPLHALAVLGEEFGELTKEIVQATYEPEKALPGAARKEAIQTAAMAIRFVMSLDVYDTSPSLQHSQASPPSNRREGGECDRYIGMTVGQLLDEIEREKGGAA